MKKLLFFAFIFFFLPHAVLATTSSVTATNDGYVYTSQTTYVAARDATTGTSDGNDLRVGQTFIDPNTYRNYRTFLSFTIPDMAAISEATLYLYGSYDFSNTDFNIFLFGADAYGPTLSGADFKNFDGWQASGVYSGAILNSSAWSSANYIAGWNSMGPFSTAGLDAVLAKKGSTFYVALVSSRDYGNNTPTGTEFAVFGSSVEATNKPYLSITYSAIAPTVTTQSASSVTATSAVFNGNITATNGATATVRGFAYGTDSTLSTVIATTTDTVGQPFSTGAFTGAPDSALTCNTTYYARAYATNSAGTGFGAVSASFTTSACSSHGSQRGTITVTSTVINNNGGTKTASDFHLFVNSVQVTSGTATSFPAPANAYTITATTDTGYTQTFSGDCDDTGHITLSPGDFKTCTVTNDDIAPASASSASTESAPTTSTLTATSTPSSSSQPSPSATAGEAGLTETQISSILEVLSSFGADADTIKNVQSALSDQSASAFTPSTDSGQTWFARNLKLNSTGPDVQALQQFLNSHGFTVSTQGPGSTGNETNLFGLLTQSALIKFQKANGIEPAVGYFGPITREMVNTI